MDDERKENNEEPVDFNDYSIQPDEPAVAGDIKDGNDGGDEGKEEKKVEDNLQ